MDASNSKAFYTVCHWTLFNKLIDLKLPMLTIRLIVYWYTTQVLFVRWGHSISETFKVRQGGVLSSSFQCVYMDDLSTNLKSSQVGCYVGTELLNHLFYADD
jgi:hypothetical protein